MMMIHHKYISAIIIIIYFQLDSLYLYINCNNMECTCIVQVLTYRCICGLPTADGVKGHKIFHINAEDLRS